MYRECGNVYAAALICGHHRPGLPDLNRELSSAEPFCGIFKKNETERKEFQKLTDERMEAYIKAHCKAMEKEFVLPEFGKRQFSALEERMMLSCLVHADWSDTGGRDTEKEEIPRRWEERLNQLDACVRCV